MAFCIVGHGAAHIKLVPTVKIGSVRYTCKRIDKWITRNVFEVPLAADVLLGQAQAKEKEILKVNSRIETLTDDFLEETRFMRRVMELDDHRKGEIIRLHQQVNIYINRDEYDKANALAMLRDEYKAIGEKITKLSIFNLLEPKDTEKRNKIEAAEEKKRIESEAAEEKKRSEPRSLWSGTIFQDRNYSLEEDWYGTILVLLLLGLVIFVCNGPY